MERGEHVSQLDRDGLPSDGFCRHGSLNLHALPCPYRIQVGWSSGCENGTNHGVEIESGSGSVSENRLRANSNLPCARWKAW